MSRITLVDTGFKVCSEGEHVFRITKVEYKKDFDKIIVSMETEEGETHTERFMLTSEGGQKAFSYLAKVALNDWSLQDIDEKELIGCYFIGVVEHTTQPNKNDPSKTVTFANIKEKKSVDEDFEGWGEKKAAAKAPVEDNDDDLDDLLG